MSEIKISSGKAELSKINYQSFYPQTNVIDPSKSKASEVKAVVQQHLEQIKADQATVVQGKRSLSKHRIESKEVNPQNLHSPSLPLLDRLIFKVLTTIIRFFLNKEIVSELEKWEKEKAAEKEPIGPHIKDLLNETVMVRMLGGLKLDESTIRKRLEEIRSDHSNLDQKTKSLAKDYHLSSKQLNQLKKLIRDPNKEIDEICKFVISSKEEGLYLFHSLHAFLSLFKLALASDQFTDDEKIILSEIQQEVHEEYGALTELRILAFEANKLGLNWLTKKSINRIADLIIHGVEKKAGQRVGKIVTSGWAGHLIDLEIEKKQGQYILSVSNVGFGAQGGQGTCQATRKFTLPATSEGEKTLRQMLVEIETLIAQQAPNDNAAHEIAKQKYYSIFEDNTVEIVDEGIEERPYQEIGNCAIRSQEELFYNKLQRLNQHDLANKLQQFIHNFAIGSAKEKYPALQEIADAKAIRPPLKPIRRQDILVHIKKHSSKKPSIIYRVPSTFGEETRSNNVQLYPKPMFSKRANGGYQIELKKDVQEIIKRKYGVAPTKVYRVRNGEEPKLLTPGTHDLEEGDRLRWEEADNQYYEVWLTDKKLAI